MRLLLLLLAVGSTTAYPWRGHGMLKQKRHVPDLATYDDACNIGYCSVMGATVGGWGGNYTTVTDLDGFASAVSGVEPGVVIVEGTIDGDTQVRVGSSKSIIGAPGSSLTGIGLYLEQSRNVILRNLKISNVPVSQGAAIVLEGSRNIWVDHCDLSSDDSLTEDGAELLSITRGSDFLTITGTLFHDHPHAISIGHSDDNGAEDEGAFHATLARNHFRNVDSAISVRFGTAHIFNSFYENVVDGINTRMGANILLESSVFEGAERAVFSDGSSEPGFATVHDVVLGTSSNTAPSGNMTSGSLLYPYNHYIWETDKVKDSVLLYAGQVLEFLVWD